MFFRNILPRIIPIDWESCAPRTYNGFISDFYLQTEHQSFSWGFYCVHEFEEMESDQIKAKKRKTIMVWHWDGNLKKEQGSKEIFY